MFNQPDLKTIDGETYSMASYLAAIMPIFVPNTTNPNETWGWGPDSDLCKSGALTCYVNATQSKL